MKRFAAGNKYQVLLVVAGLLQAITTVVLVIITWRYVGLTRDMLTVQQHAFKLQVDPQVDLEFLPEGPQVVIMNRSPNTVLDVSLEVVAVQPFVFDSPPARSVVTVLLTRRDNPWWHLNALTPGERQERSIREVVLSEGGPREEKETDRPIHIFQLTFDRDFDRKRYTIVREVDVYRALQGDRLVIDTRALGHGSHRDLLTAAIRHRFPWASVQMDDITERRVDAVRDYLREKLRQE